MLPAGLTPLRHRKFRLFWGAGAASDIGTWVQLAAIGSLVAVSSGSALATGMVAAATFAPQGICSPLGGLLADRFERRRTFLATLGIQAVMTTIIAIAIASGVRSPAMLSLLVLCQASAGALGGPSLQAILPDLVPASELTAAVALGVTSWNSGRVVGPLIATALVPIGVHWAVAANAASFAVLWCAIASNRGRFHPAATHWVSARTELLNGIRALRASAGCVAALATIVTIHLCFVPFMGLIPSTARGLLERGGGLVTDSSVTSISARLLSAQGIGAIVGSLLIANLVRRFKRSSIVTLALATAAVMVSIHQYMPGWATTAVVIFTMGSCVAMTQSVLGGVIQRDASRQHRGRILSWYQGLNGLGYGVGLLVMGLASDAFGLRATFMVSGILTATLIVVAHRLPRWAADLDGLPVELDVIPDLDIEHVGAPIAVVA
ncbi:MAG: MFS transporter [Ilumatobacteraceae bacterium]